MASDTASIQRLRNLRRRLKFLTTATIVSCSLITPAAALASGTDTVWSGTLYNFDGWQTVAPRHSLTSVSVSASSRQNGDSFGCVNALNSDGSGWAGETWCGYPTRSHPYCGCSPPYRTGYALTTGFTGGAWVNGYWWQAW